MHKFNQLEISQANTMAISVIFVWNITLCFSLIIYSLFVNKKEQSFLNWYFLGNGFFLGLYNAFLTLSSLLFILFAILINLNK